MNTVNPSSTWLILTFGQVNLALTFNLYSEHWKVTFCDVLFKKFGIYVKCWSITKLTVMRQVGHLYI